MAGDAGDALLYMIELDGHVVPNTAAWIFSDL